MKVGRLGAIETKTVSGKGWFGFDPRQRDFGVLRVGTPKARLTTEWEQGSGSTPGKSVTKWA